MIVDESVYLQHYGRKGMRWGVRTAKPTMPGPSKPRPLTGAAKTNQERKIAVEKKIKRQRNLKRAAIAGGTLAVGGVIAASIISRNRSIKATQLQQAAQLKSFQSSLSKSQQLLDSMAKVKYTSVQSGFAVSKSGVATPLNTLVRLGG